MDEDVIIEHVKKLEQLVRRHEKWRNKKTINLLASENFASSETRYFLSTDLSNRYNARDHFYRGTKYSDEIEMMATEVAKKLFRAKYADVRPLSGHTCSLILFLSFLKPGDFVVTCPPKYGGYPGTSELGLGPLLSLKNLYFPYDPKIMNIVPAETRSLLSSKKPNMTIFGSSFIPFPYAIRDSIPDEYQGVRVYDGSHVLGLIAGGEFQDPLGEGCNVLIGSTHKSFFGPQGGLILSNDKAVFDVIQEKIFPGIVDNIHLNRVAALTYSMLELMRFGKRYARQVIVNSRTLARALYELKIPVKCAKAGFTNSHQVLLDYNEDMSVKVANSLEEVGVITDVGIRLGTAEVTRFGMQQDEMEKIAIIVADTIKKKEPIEKTQRRVQRLAKDFRTPKFTFK